MAKKSRLDNLENVDGPFSVPDSLFAEADPAPEDPPFTDADVAAIMGEEDATWVPDPNSEFSPPVEPPAAPPPPPPPPADQKWVSEGAPIVGFQDGDDLDETEVPGPNRPTLAPMEPLFDPDATAEGPIATPTPPPAPRDARPPPMKSSGLVVEYKPEEVEKAPAPDADADIGSSALTWMALGLGGAIFGIVGALVVVLVLTSAPGPDPATVAPTEPRKIDGKIPVRRGLNAPPPKLEVPEDEPDDDEPSDDPPSGDPPADDGTVPVTPP